MENTVSLAEALLTVNQYKLETKEEAESFVKVHLKASRFETLDELKENTIKSKEALQIVETLPEMLVENLKVLEDYQAKLEKCEALLER